MHGAAYKALHPLVVATRGKQFQIAHDRHQEMVEVMAIPPVSWPTAPICCAYRSANSVPSCSSISAIKSLVRIRELLRPLFHVPLKCPLDA